MASDLKFIKSSRGNDVLYYKGFQYLKRSELKGTKIVWRCRFYRQLKCKSTMHTSGFRVVKLPGDHTNESKPEQFLAQQVLQAIDKDATQVGATTRNVLGNI